MRTAPWLAGIGVWLSLAWGPGWGSEPSVPDGAADKEVLLGEKAAARPAKPDKLPPRPASRPAAKTPATPAPAAPTSPALPTARAPETVATSEPAGAPPASAADLTTAATEAGSSPPELLGDVPPFPARVLSPAGSGSSALLPSARGFKIADNESPQPRDRVYFSFNYFDDLYGSANRDRGAPIRNIRVYRETFGLEKTCLGGAASVGLRLPLNEFFADTSLAGLTGTPTTVGDLSIILKYALWRSADNSRVVSAGLAVTAPTGPDSFAASGLRRFHSTTLQPFAGYLWAGGNCFLHGFAAVDVPTDANDVTLLFNDLGVGYFLYRAAEPDRFLTAVAPTFEVHVNTPLNHRGGPILANALVPSDVVNLTAGVNLMFLGKTRLGLGVVAPVTGPRPFDVEVVAQLRCSF